MSFLAEHTNGCTPLKPCTNCESVRFLRNQLGDSKFSEFIRILGEEYTITEVQPVPLETKLDDIKEFQNLSIRTEQIFKNENVTTIGDIVSKSEFELLRWPNFGRKSLNEIKGKLASVGHFLST